MLYVGRLRSEYQGAPIGIDEGLAFAAFHFLARVVATRSAALDGLDTLAVKHGSGGRGLLTDPLSRLGGGTIVNTSSVHQIIPKPGFLSYSLSKGGLGNLTLTLALECNRPVSAL